MGGGAHSFDSLYAKPWQRKTAVAIGTMLWLWIFHRAQSDYLQTFVRLSPLQ